MLIRKLDCSQLKRVSPYDISQDGIRNKHIYYIIHEISYLFYRWRNEDGIFPKLLSLFIQYPSMRIERHMQNGNHCDREKTFAKSNLFALPFPHTPPNIKHRERKYVNSIFIRPLWESVKYFFLSLCFSYGAFQQEDINRIGPA